jgi:hypothetical protein
MERIASSRWFNHNNEETEEPEEEPRREEKEKIVQAPGRRDTVIWVILPPIPGTTVNKCIAYV